VSQFLEKKEQFKSQLKTQKQRMIAEVTKMDEQHQAEVSALTLASNELRADLVGKEEEVRQMRAAHSAASELEELRAQMNAELIRVKSAYAEKEKKYKTVVTELASEIEDLKIQHEKERQDDHQAWEVDK